MATTCRLNNGSVLNQPRRAYVTTGAFADAIFSYTTSTSVSNGQVNTTGVLAALGASVVTSTYNVAGTVLRENGRKIIPGVNPITTGTVQYYVGVYHPEFGSGFIDPNNALFAVYNSDKPYIYNGTDLLENDLGPPVITAGSIASTSPTAGIGYATGAGATVTQGTNLTTAVTINAVCGSIVSYSTGGGGVTINANTAAEFTVNNSVVDATDVIILSAREIQNTALVANVSEIGTDYFKVAILNTTASGITLTSAPITLNFAVIKAVTA